MPSAASPRARAGRVVVVGGGIAGLAAAHRLRELSPEVEIVVLERSPRIGGKIHTVPFAGAPIETGAETFLMRDGGEESAALALARRVGLGDALVHPAPVAAALAIGDELRPIPAGTLMGIPAEPGPRDLDNGRPVVPVGQDVAVGPLVRSRYGDDVVRHLVDPLLGGVYAGRADDLSLEATIPGLHRAAQHEHTLAQAVRSALRAAPRPAGAPVFASVHGGLSRFVDTVAAAARVTVECGQTVRALQPTSAGWRVVAGATGRESRIEADAVILAVPARPAVRLLSDVDASAAATVGELGYASVALVTLALPAGTALPELSGFLVPADQGLRIKAATFVTTKWPHLRGEAVVVRASLGRYGEPEETRTLQHTDEALAQLARRDLERILGPLPEPVAARVNRWGGALPQYGVGHVTRVESVRARLPASLALAGAAYDGVGIAACVRSGEAAALRVQGVRP